MPFQSAETRRNLRGLRAVDNAKPGVRHGLLLNPGLCGRGNRRIFRFRVRQLQQSTRASPPELVCGAGQELLPVSQVRLGRTHAERFADMFEDRFDGGAAEGLESSVPESKAPEHLPRFFFPTCPNQVPSALGQSVLRPALDPFDAPIELFQRFCEPPVHFHATVVADAFRQMSRKLLVKQMDAAASAELKRRGQDVQVLQDVFPVHVDSRRP